VTARAFRSYAQPALVIILVAGLAGSRKFEGGRVLGRMATFALQPLMRAGYRITSLTRVIVFPFAPCERVVATPATRVHAKPALVKSVLMAFLASERRFLVVGRAVTALARNRHVLAYKGKAGSIVIECDILAPVKVVMTTLAAITELSFVRILLLMTGDARCRQFVSINEAGVTGVALDFHMGASKRELGLLVIELRLFPLVLIVTGLTFDAVTSCVNVLQPVT
jgi:hypothetical protein